MSVRLPVARCCSRDPRSWRTLKAWRQASTEALGQVESLEVANKADGVAHYFDDVGHLKRSVLSEHQLYVKTS